MLVLLILFLYVVIGVVTAMLMVRFADYEPNHHGESSPLLVVVAWPVVVLIVITISINYALNKLILSAKKEKTNDSN